MKDYLGWLLAMLLIIGGAAIVFLILWALFGPWIALFLMF